ncbi:MAG: hypothetical protein JO093_03845 [Acidobacteria bacterium]|nr:hypothetical protein [Acidobacteriota bacterium]MBV9070402.1 hypothetical protein [Acidobacteriota bacterium]MBV9184723.1 hypothetical protein [Acidobacteriota bacterium]
MRDLRRITLIARGAMTAGRSWDASNRATNRIIFVNGFSILTGALHHASQDVERLVIDGAATESQFLDLLTTLPGDFFGDVLFVSGDDRAFLSTTCRAGGRMLYAMLPADVQFYFEAHRLVTKTSIAA